MRGAFRAPVVAAALILSLLAVTVASAAIAPGGTEEPEKDKVVGTIVSIDAKAGTLVVRDEMKKGNVAKETTFYLSKKPRIVVDGKAARIEDLKPGVNVKVSFRHEGKKRVAHSIETTTKTKK